MFKNEDHNSWMILGLANTLANSGVLDEKDRKAIFELGYTIERYYLVNKSKKLLEEINDILNKK